MGGSRDNVLANVSWFNMVGPSLSSRKSTCRKLRRLRSIAVLAACVTALVAPMSARADWPERQVKLIVTFPPGSANDAAARIFADALGKKWGKPVVVEDRPGAEGTIGVGSFVANQDDHTLLYTVAGSITVAPLLVDRLPYDVNQRSGADCGDHRDRFDPRGQQRAPSQQHSGTDRGAAGQPREICLGVRTDPAAICIFGIPEATRSAG